MAEPLAPRQKDVYHFILDHVERHECSPTVREIADGLGVASTNTIDYHLKALERKGYVRRRGGAAPGSPCRSAARSPPACRSRRSSTPTRRSTSPRPWSAPGIPTCC